MTSLARSSRLVQEIEQFVDPVERGIPHQAVVHDTIAVALQRSPSGFSQSPGQERRSDCPGSDIQADDASPLAIKSEPRCSEEVAGHRRQSSETAGGFFLQIVELVLAPAPCGAGIEFE